MSFREKMALTAYEHVVRLNPKNPERWAPFWLHWVAVRREDGVWE